MELVRILQHNGKEMDQHMATILKCWTVFMPQSIGAA